MENCEGEDELAMRVESINVNGVNDGARKTTRVVDLLRRFLGVQQRRGQVYAKLRR